MRKNIEKSYGNDSFDIIIFTGNTINYATWKFTENSTMLNSIKQANNSAEISPVDQQDNVSNYCVEMGLKYGLLKLPNSKDYLKRR